MREDLPGTAQVVLNQSASEYDIESAHHTAGVDDAVGIVESLGYDRAYVIGGAGIYNLFQPIVDQIVLSQIPGEYDGDAYFPDWDRTEWIVVDRTLYDDFTLEERDLSERIVIIGGYIELDWGQILHRVGVTT